MGEFVGLLLFAPLMMLVERVQAFQRLSSVEQNLQRASHGAALIGLVLFVASGTHSSVGGFVRAVARDPVDMWQGLLLLLLLAYGLTRFFAGVRRSWGMRDGMLAARAVGKIAVGVVVAVVVWNPPAGWFSRDTLATIYAFRMIAPPYSEWAIEVVVFWCIVTGVVRFVLAISGGFRFRREGPRPMPMPHGESRFAKSGEGQRAMQAQGQTSRMDGRKF